MELSFVIDERPFRATKLNARQQLHLSRRLAPLVPAIAPLVMDLARSAAAAKQRGEESLTLADVLNVVDLAGPFADALAGMKDADADAVMDMTLGSVKVETAPGTWMPLWIAGSSSSLVEDLNDLPKLLPVIIKVLQLNLANFTFGFLTSRGEPAQRSSGENSPTARAG